jgi:catechol 2,3-dioxygenase-like lactoylglutathione lyase family enzyme
MTLRNFNTTFIGDPFMLQDSPAFSGFSVDDLEVAKVFYGETLGLTLESSGPGLRLVLANGTAILIYPKEDHVPATFTILNFPVDNIDQAVDQLASKGVVFESYEGMTDEKGIARGIAAQMGPDIAWFKDPAGNVLSVLCEG